MSDTVLITSQDTIIETLNFKPYRSTVERRVKKFQPPPGMAQDVEVPTPWGETLTANAGDYLVGELGAPPEDQWPVESDIFESTYVFTAPGRCVKKALTYLVPLVDAAGGNPDQKVAVQTLEGTVTVRAGDFYLARGIKGEIWPYPKDKVGTIMAPVEE